MRINYRELKQQIRLLDLLQRIGWKSTKGRGEQLRGPCPLPDCCVKSSNRSTNNDHAFSIHTTKNVYQCFRCRSTGNILDFWQTYRATSLHQAAIELCEYLETSNRTST
jgi:hypothetical protein